MDGDILCGKGDKVYDMIDTRITVKEATEAIYSIMSKLPPPGKKDIELIKRNPSLNLFQKIRLIRMIERCEA